MGIAKSLVVRKRRIMINGVVYMWGIYRLLWGVGWKDGT